MPGVLRFNKVSVAWVVRDAAEKYVDDQMPLFHQQPREQK